MDYYIIINIKTKKVVFESDNVMDIFDMLETLSESDHKVYKETNLIVINK